VVTDDLDMKAIAKEMHYPEGIAAVLNAGCDLSIVSNFHDGDSDKPIRIARLIGEALKGGYISEEIVFRSFKRLESLYNQLQFNSVQQLPDDLIKQHCEFANEVARS
jgi:beta-glucosidase-like glycosyl hydrolase